MELGNLGKLLMDVYSDLYSSEEKRRHYTENIVNYKELEAQLVSYLNNIYAFKFDYSKYYAEVRMYFENLLVNIQNNKGINLAKDIEEYVNKFNHELDCHPLSKALINKARKLYSSDDCDSVVRHNNKSYMIQRIYREREMDMPSIYIPNIDELEEVLSDLINNVKTSKSKFKTVLLETTNKDDEIDEISELLVWIVKNSTCYELTNITDYFRKYNQYISDNTFEKLENPIKIGTLLDQDLRVKIRKSNYQYETPYFLSFILGNSEIMELPNIRLGIENHNNKTVANILAVQTSQDNLNQKYFEEQSIALKNLFKTENKKYRKEHKSSTDIRHVNTLHIYSIILTLGLLKGMDIDQVQVSSYLPLRLQKKILMDHCSEEETDKYQHRLTDQNMMTYIKIVSDMTGIEIEEYPDLDGTLKLAISNNVESDNELFQLLYNYGLKAGNKLKEENTDNKSNKVLVKQ